MKSNSSKYSLIENDILEKIKTGKLQPGDKVDSESVLKNKYKVSTITVRKAFNDLINNGYLYGVQGLGTFVAKKQMVRGLTSMNLYEELLQQGFNVATKIISIEEINDKRIGEILGSKDGNCICYKRVRLANGSPLAFHTSYFKKPNEVIVDDLKKSNSFYRALKKNGVNISWVQETYSVRAIEDKQVYTNMGFNKGDYSFFTKRIGYDDYDNPVEYSETYFNKDNYSVTVTIQKK